MIGRSPFFLSVSVLLLLNAIASIAGETVQAATDRAVNPVKKPFTATLVEYDRGTKGSRSRTRIYMGDDGIRSERLSNKSDEILLVVINNYRKNQTWLINPALNSFAEFPNSTNKKVKASDLDRASSPRVLANAPCIGMQGEKQSTRTVGNSELSVWRCTDSNGMHHLQHFSTLLGVVIRQESQNGQISELQDIALLDQSAKYFEPSEELHEISIGELIAGKYILPDYTE